MENLLTEWARLLFASFADAGVTDVVASPGSRNTPFLLAAASEGRLCVHDAIDERAGGFFALGQARVTGRPSVLLCTSGTAGAHYAPAVIEAAHAHVPMVVVTADRPFELMACAAPQTIDQTKLFGDHARAFFELGMPDPAPLALRAARRMVAQAVFASQWPLPGAVQINARARKPLEPPVASSAPGAAALRDAVIALLARPIPRAAVPMLAPDPDAVRSAASLIASRPRGLIICGPAPLDTSREALLALARSTGYPLCAESTSQLRFLPHPADGRPPPASVAPPILADAQSPGPASPPVAREPDAAPSDRSAGSPSVPTPPIFAGERSPGPSSPRVAREPDAAPSSPPVFADGEVVFADRFDVWMRGARGAVAPELVVQVGGAPTSGAYEALLQSLPGVPRIMIGREGWRDPSSGDGLHLISDVELGAQALAAWSFEDEDRRAWRRRVAAAEEAAGAAVAESLAGPALTEGEVARALAAAMPDGSLLALGNSLAIRLADTFAARSSRDVGVLSQRGVNGIDGLIAGAAGAARVSGRVAALLIGDVSFLHDLGGLGMARGLSTPFVVVVLHNQGGRIFEQLPIAAAPGVPPEALAHVLTPHALDLSHAAALYGHAFARAHDRAALAAALAEALAHHGCTVIEAPVPPGSAAAQMRRIAATFAARP